MIFSCSNCSNRFRKWIDKGIKSEGQGGICDYCGTADSPENPFTFKKPDDSVFRPPIKFDTTEK